MLLLTNRGGTHLSGLKNVKLCANVFLSILFPLASLPLSARAGDSQPGKPQPGHPLTSAEIVHRSVAVNTADWKAQPDYSYRELDIKSKIDATGQTRTEASKTYEVMMIDGSPYDRLIAIHNEPLSHAQEQQEAAKLKSEIEHRQAESAREKQARTGKYQNERSEEHMLMQQMVAAFNFRYAGEQQIEGSDCYVLDAIPNPDYHPPVERARVLTGMKGRLWIDKARYHWVKVQAEVMSPVAFGLFIAKVKPGTSFELEQAPVGDVWLPKTFIETVNATVLGFYGMRTREEEHYSDYHQTLLSARR